VPLALRTSTLSSASVILYHRVNDCDSSLHFGRPRRWENPLRRYFAEVGQRRTVSVKWRASRTALSTFFSLALPACFVTDRLALKLALYYWALCQRVTSPCGWLWAY
jgi:hypothetical protein